MTTTSRAAPLTKLLQISGVLAWLYAGYLLYELYDALPENLGGWW